MIAYARLEELATKLDSAVSHIEAIVGSLASQASTLTERIECGDDPDYPVEPITAREIDTALAMYEATANLIANQCDAAAAKARGLREFIDSQREDLKAPVKSERPSAWTPGVQDHGGIRDQFTE